MEPRVGDAIGFTIQSNSQRPSLAGIYPGPAPSHNRKSSPRISFMYRILGQRPRVFELRKQCSVLSA
jgi:hypothetical protein